jgi:hypothetical protein
MHALIGVVCQKSARSGSLGKGLQGRGFSGGKAERFVTSGFGRVKGDLKIS